jgi:hypothetical protein
MTGVDLLPRNRFEMIYNGVDISRVGRTTASARHFAVALESPKIGIVTQVCWMIPEKGITIF